MANRYWEDLSDEAQFALLDYLVEQGLLVTEDDGLMVTPDGEAYIVSGETPDAAGSDWDLTGGDHTGKLTIRVVQGADAGMVGKLQRICEASTAELASKGITLTWEIEVLEQKL